MCQRMPQTSATSVPGRNRTYSSAWAAVRVKRGSQTMIGALLNYIHTPTKNFQPMNSNMGILPSQKRRREGKRDRYTRMSRRAIDSMRAYRDAHEWLFDDRSRSAA